MSANGEAQVLVVDDEPALRYTLRAILEDEGIAVAEAADGRAALALLESQPIALVLTDLHMPGMDGLALLDALSSRPDAPQAIMITAHGSERVAVDAMKRGALDYFTKPFDPDEVARVVRRALEHTRIVEENQALRAELALGRTMVFRSEAMRRVALLVERVAPRKVSVLVTGESGTGKELVARAIVRASDRARKPYLRFNCAALRPELAEAELFGHARGAFTGADRARTGMFREAEGGTLLLDEVAELDARTQGALLRVLQEGEVRAIGEERTRAVDVRLLAATHADLRKEIEAKRFREDLFYRLHVVTIHIPPLRERREDIVLLAEHFTRQAAEAFGVGEVRLSDRVLRLLEAAPWPGNVRELQHVVERLVALSSGTLIDEDPFDDGSGTPRPARGPGGLRQQVQAFERELIRDALAACHGNQSETARQLGISRVTLIDKLKRYGLR
jgi:two-component system response regulator HydG